MTFLFWFAVLVGMPWASYLLVKVWTAEARFRDVDRLARRDR